MAPGQEQLMELYCTFPSAQRNDMQQEEFDTAQLLRIYSIPYLSRQESGIFWDMTILWHSSYLSRDRRYNGLINTFKITYDNLR